MLCLIIVRNRKSEWNWAFYSRLYNVMASSYSPVGIAPTATQWENIKMQSKHRVLRGFKEWKKTIRKILVSYTHYNDDSAFLNRKRSSEDTADIDNNTTHCGHKRSKFSMTWGRCGQKGLVKSRQYGFKCQAVIFYQSFHHDMLSR